MRRGMKFTVYNSSGRGGGFYSSAGTGGLFTRWLVLTAAVLITAYLFDSIHVDSFLTALLASAVIGVLNMLLRPVLLVLTLPVNVLSFGLFTFLINALMLKIASGVISGFTVTGFWSTVFGAMVISIVSWILNIFLMTAVPSGSPRGTQSSGDIELTKKGDRWE